ncbi:hypothetical protein BDZ97DRAFT_1848755 [Flammula alnicola]|nr:hypothetical protein BDZ97DRAFT_1848755 [Flammula alnicola]
MQANLPLIGDLPLCEICLSSSHDAGMYHRNDGSNTRKNIETNTPGKRVRASPNVFDHIASKFKARPRSFQYQP